VGPHILAKDEFHGFSQFVRAQALRRFRGEQIRDELEKKGIALKLTSSRGRLRRLRELTRMWTRW